MSGDPFLKLHQKKTEVKQSGGAYLEALRKEIEKTAGERQFRGGLLMPEDD